MNKDKPLLRTQRPVNLDLRYFHFPISALVSITHRITGMALFVGLIFFLWAFEQSLLNVDAFLRIKALFQNNGWVKLFTWVLLSILMVHFIVGIRHLLMDMHIGDSRQGGQYSAFITIGFCVICLVLLGVWLW